MGTLKIGKFTDTRIILLDGDGDVVFDKRYFYFANFKEARSVNYGYYLDNIKGVSGRLEDLIV